MLINSFNYQERFPAKQFQDGDILDFGKTRLRVIHTPGHTPGHCGFFCESENLLFLGDIDLTPFGPWYGDAVSDIAETIDSVHWILDIPAEVFVTSHNMGIITGDITDLAKAYLDVIYEREEKIVNFLSAPRTLQEIAEQWFILLPQNSVGFQHGYWAKRHK
ncbi:MAG: MBL fold metallo-hydrolase [Desulfobacterales bacterium]